MAKRLFTLALLCAGPLIPVTGVAATNDDDHPAALSTQPVTPAIEWNRTLLSIVRTPGAEPPTIPSTRNFAILHAANYRVLYAATQRVSCFVETLARFRPDISLIAELQAIAGEDDYMPLGTVPSDWCEPCVMGEDTVTGEYATCCVGHLVPWR